MSIWGQMNPTLLLRGGIPHTNSMNCKFTIWCINSMGCFWGLVWFVWQEVWERCYSRKKKKKKKRLNWRKSEGESTWKEKKQRELCKGTKRVKECGSALRHRAGQVLMKDLQKFPNAYLRCFWNHTMMRLNPWLVHLCIFSMYST